ASSFCLNCPLGLPLRGLCVLCGEILFRPSTAPPADRSSLGVGNSGDRLAATRREGYIGAARAGAVSFLVVPSFGGARRASHPTAWRGPMSTAGKVLVVLAALVMVAWIILFAMVGLLNRNWGEKVESLQQEQAKQQEALPKAEDALAKTLDEVDALQVD